MANWSCYGSLLGYIWSAREAAVRFVQYFSEHLAVPPNPHASDCALKCMPGRLRHYGKLNEPPDDFDPAIDHHVVAKKVAVWALVLGLFMEFLVGPLLDMAAYGFAPASLIAPLASVQLLVNIIVAPHTLNEERLPGHIISAVVIGVAIVGITIFGHHPEPEFSLELLEALFRSALPDRKFTGGATGMAMRCTVAAQEVDRFLLLRVLLLLAVLPWVFGGGTSATGRSHTWCVQLI
jgi:hypothetical protein